MIRNVLVGLGILVAAIVAFQLIFVSELERVEDEMERLFELGRRGGEDSLDEIAAAFADDYRGAGPFARDRLLDRLRWALVPAGNVSELTHGDFQPVAKGDEILVPIVSVRANVRGQPVAVIVAVTWGRRDGNWKIVDVSRWSR